MTYNISYFINKFQAIPKKEWCAEEFEDNKGRKCAQAHCGRSWKEIPEECKALNNLLNNETSLINDGSYLYLGKHPKTRIVNRLKELSEKV